MQRVGSREFKNRMGKYLKVIRKGQCLMLTDRGKPIAKISPPEEAQSELTVEDVLQRLEAEGKIRIGRRPLVKFRAIPSRGKSASQMIIEDRR